MQCFAIPFKPLGPKMAKTVSCSNTTDFERILAGERLSLIAQRKIEKEDEEDTIIIEQPTLVTEM